MDNENCNSSEIDEEPEILPFNNNGVQASFARVDVSYDFMTEEPIQEIHHYYYNIFEKSFKNRNKDEIATSPTFYKSN